MADRCLDYCGVASDADDRWADAMRTVSRWNSVRSDSVISETVIFCNEAITHGDCRRRLCVAVVSICDTRAAAGSATFDMIALHTKLYSPIIVETQNTTMLNKEIKCDS